jgi:hypothetical protein
MKKNRFRIERRDLAAYQTTELRSMANYADRVGETLAQVEIESGLEILADLEDAIGDEIAAIGAVVGRILRRIGKELATRK